MSPRNVAHSCRPLQLPTAVPHVGLVADRLRPLASVDTDSGVCPKPVVQEGTLNEDRVEFRVATFSVADVAGYAPLTGADEEGTFATLKTSSTS